MGAHRDLAIFAMKAMSNPELGQDFMRKAKIDMPEPIVDGALPAMGREEFRAIKLNKPVDMVVLWTIGDFLEGHECSAYYDPSSRWYNVFYGAYGVRSYKPDRSAWGYSPDGKVLFQELFELAAIDYNYLTAGYLGCPPDRMSFHIDPQDVVEGTRNGWDSADIRATVPSALHEAHMSLGQPKGYIIYGVPSARFLGNGRQNYEPVRMRGRLFMRQIRQQVLPQPITLAWGALCPETDEGDALLSTIIDTLGKAYFPIEAGA